MDAKEPAEKATPQNDPDYDLVRDSFRRMMVQGNQAQVATIRNEVQSLTRHYEQACRQAIGYGQQLSDHYGRIKNLQDATGEEYDENLRMICELPQVIGIRVEAPEGQRGLMLVVYLDNSYCIDNRTERKHMIGRQKVMINLEQRNISIYNLDFTIVGHGNERMQAPHIFPAGNMCMGTAGADFRKLLSFRDCFQIILLTLQFLESVNLDDAAGKYINHWPIIRNDGTITVFASVTCKPNFTRHEDDPAPIDPLAEGWNIKRGRLETARNYNLRPEDRLIAPLPEEMPEEDGRRTRRRQTADRDGGIPPVPPVPELEETFDEDDTYEE